ncbi:MAG: hypothetical protein D3925_02005 [Candidatus Electrothrix sp. AR5]|nr:hypothetical protein [Candidatus Electrothrix sp. AR5]
MGTEHHPVEKLFKQFEKFGYNDRSRHVTLFHNLIFRAINHTCEDYRESLEKENDASVSIDDHVSFYESYISNNVKNFTLVMHVSSFEEISYYVCKDVGIKPGSSSLDRFKQGWIKKLSKPIGEMQAWCILQDAAKIRNTILHAGGIISLSSDKELIMDMIKRKQLEKNGERFYVTNMFLDKVSHAVYDMIVNLQ